MWQFGLLPLASVQIQAAGLGGSAITPLAGTPQADRSVALTTSAITCSPGSLGSTHSKPLDAGSEDFPLFFPYTRITSSGGVVGVVEDDNPELSGSSSTASAGTVIPTYSRALTTSASTCSAGSLGVENKPTQTALGAITSETGIVVPNGFNVTANLNAGEVEMVAAAGSVSAASALTGTAITSALQSFAAVLNTPTNTLLGIQSAMGLGTMAANQDVEDTFIQSRHGSLIADLQQALTTILITGSQGTVTDTEDITLALVGEEDSALAGTVVFEVGTPLTGEQFLGEQYFVGAPGYADLVGAESIVSTGELRAFTGNDRDTPLTTSLITATSDWNLPYTTIIRLSNVLIQSEQYLFYKEAALEGMAIEMGQGFVGRKHRVDAGRHGKDDSDKKDKKPKKVKVIIDDEVFEFKNLSEAEDFHQHVLEAAAEKAKADADAIVAKALADKDKEAKVLLKVPEISDEELQAKVAALYAQAQIDAQVALEVARLRQVDEEESLVLLLLN